MAVMSAFVVARVNKSLWLATLLWDGQREVTQTVLIMGTTQTPVAANLSAASIHVPQQPQSVARR